MTLKLVSAYVYGFGFGVLSALVAVDQYSYVAWGVITVIFTTAFWMDIRANDTDQ